MPRTATVEPDSLQLFLNEVSRHRLLTADEEQELAQRIERGDLDAKQRMVNSNLRLVVSIAKHYQGQHVPLVDLIQEGMLGPDPRGREVRLAAGLKFSTYATPWVRQSIERGIAYKARTIRVPVHVLQRERKIGRAAPGLAAKLGREPTDEELAAAVELPVQQVRRCARPRARSRASTSTVGEGEETTLGGAVRERCRRAGRGAGREPARAARAPGGVRAARPRARDPAAALRARRTTGARSRSSRWCAGSGVSRAEVRQHRALRARAPRRHAREMRGRCATSPDAGSSLGSVRWSR